MTFEQAYFYIIIGFVMWAVVSMAFGIGMAPSARVFPRHHPIRTHKDRQKLFERLRLRYTPTIIFAKDCRHQLSELSAESLNSYYTLQTRYDMLSRKYSPYLTFQYMAPVKILWVSNRVGYGLFADQPIQHEAFIMEYGGEARKNSDDGTWAWAYPSQSGFWLSQNRYSLAANRCGNEARFANHDEMPNVKIELIHEGEMWHLVYIASRDIQEGEELLVNYGTGYWQNRWKTSLQKNIPRIQQEFSTV